MPTCLVNRQKMAVLNQYVKFLTLELVSSSCDSTVVANKMYVQVSTNEVLSCELEGLEWECLECPGCLECLEHLGCLECLEVANLPKVAVLELETWSGTSCS